MFFMPVTTLQDAAQATGNGTPLEVAGYGCAALQVTISDTATITFEGTVDNSTWVSVNARNVADDSYQTTATASAIYVVNAQGLQFVRARISAYTSGTVTVVGSATEAFAPAASTVSAAASTKVTDDTGSNVWSIDSSGNGPVTLNGSKVDVALGSAATITLAAGAEIVLETINWESEEIKDASYSMKVDSNATTGLTVRWEGAYEVDFTNIVSSASYVLGDSITSYNTGVLVPTAPYNRLVVKNTTDADRFVRRWSRVGVKI